MRLMHIEIRPFRRAVLITAAALIAVVLAGAAYAINWRASAGVPSAEISPAALRSQIIARMNDLGQRQLAPAAQAQLETIHERADGLDWSLTTYRNSTDEQCFMEAIPGDGRGYRCVSRTTLFGHGPLAVEWGSRQNIGGNLQQWDAAWIRGFSRAPVTTVEAVLTDCSEVRLSLSSDGSFFRVFGEQTMHSGAWPSLVRGLNAQGAVVSQRQVELEQPNAKGALIAGPAVSPACD